MRASTAGQPSRPPAFVVGGLNLVRPLGLAGVPVLVATSDADNPALHSRYCGARLALPPMESGEAFLGALAEAGAALAGRFGSKPPLIYGNDDWLDFIQAFRAELEPHFGFVLNDPDVAGALIAKDSFAHFAARRGVAVPRTLSWDAGGPDSLDSFAGPVLAKPKVKIAWEHSAALMRLLGNTKGEASKARVFASGRALRDHPLAGQLRHVLTFQEYVAGDDRCLWSFHGFADERGGLLASFVGRKIRTFPALTGSSSYLELAHDPELEILGREIVDRLSLKGPFKIDLKRDSTTGRYYVLEVNARYTLWHYPGACNGVNLPRIAYDYLVDGTRPSPAPRHGTAVRWLCLGLDLRAHRELAAKGESSGLKWLLSLAGSRKVYDLFSWSDPLPFLHVVRSKAARRIERVIARVGIRLRRWLSTAS
jgi:D-aspartate ligase